MIQKNALRLIPALLATVFAGAAGASGFQLIEQNASGIGSAYAGSAAIAENAGTIFYNPAGMTQLQAREFSVGFSAIRPSFKFSNDASSLNLLPAPFAGPARNPLSGDGGDGGGWGFVPNAYLSWAVNKDLYLGLGLGAPFGMKTDFDENWRGAAQSIKFDIKTINLNPSLAYRVNDTVSLGLGINWQRLEAEYVRRVGVADYLPFPGAASTARLKLNDDTWGWNVGALFTLSPATRIGLSYRSAMKYTVTGDVIVSGPSANLNRAASSDASASIKLPDTFILSATHQLNERWQLLGDISWTGWSSIPRVDIVRDSNTALYVPGVAGQPAGATAQTLHTAFRDTWRFALGAHYQWDPAWKLKMGLAYDQSPVRDADTRLVSLPDNNRIWLAFGAQWKPSKEAALDIGLAYLHVSKAHIHNDQRASVTGLPTPAKVQAALAGNRGLVDGDFKDNAWVLGAQYSRAF